MTTKRAKAKPSGNEKSHYQAKRDLYGCWGIEAYRDGEKASKQYGDRRVDTDVLLDHDHARLV
jgi:hypothetical protein